MQFQNFQQRPERPAVQMVEVRIPTATAIICSTEDPYLVLLGHSKKHVHPVLPGGKIETQDLLSTSLEASAARCLSRELAEEIGSAETSLEFLAIFDNPTKDIRVVRAASLRGTLVEDAIKHLPDNEMVLGCYGVPDFAFVGAICPSRISDSDELNGLFWADIRTLDLSKIGAGHSSIIARYLEKLAANDQRAA